MGKKLLSGQLELPAFKKLPTRPDVIPHFFVADAAFPLRTTLLKPYPGRALGSPMDDFNYRLSRARRCVENSFGIASSRFRILRRAITATRENAVEIVKAVCVLHNFLLSSNIYCPAGFADAEVDGKLTIELES